MKTGCVILAAGAGRRMGGVNKALLLWQGKTFLQDIADRLRKLGDVECVVVVATPHDAETEVAAGEEGYPCVRNAHPERGMASSVAAGFAYASANFATDACWLWPVDAPGASLEVLRIIRSRGAADRIVTPRFAGRGGHPSLVGRTIWPELESCESEAEGARSVFRKDSHRRDFVDVDDHAVAHDFDCPTDLGASPC